MKSKIKAMLFFMAIVYVCLVSGAAIFFGFLHFVLLNDSIESYLSLIKMYSVVLSIPSIGLGIWFLIKQYYV